MRNVYILKLFVLYAKILIVNRWEAQEVVMADRRVGVEDTREGGSSGG